MNAPVIALDLGGTWIKGVAASQTGQFGLPLRQPNPLRSTNEASRFAGEVAEFCLKLTGGVPPRAIVAATAGEVSPSGKQYLCAGAHLGVMGASPWVDLLAKAFDCPVTLINDAEAFMLGAAERGRLPMDRDVGGLVVGTGVGFSVVRYGRWWKPARRLIHFGSVGISNGDYNQLLGSSRILENGEFSFEASEGYLEELAGVLASAVNLFHLDHVIVGGGVVDAMGTMADVSGKVSVRLNGRLLPGLPLPGVTVLADSNRAILEGAMAVALGHEAARRPAVPANFSNLATERIASETAIEQLPPREMVATLIREETDAAGRFAEAAAALATGAQWLAEAIRNGGRVIYLGAGTSGRVGALDAVEIPCTFGLAPDRFVAVIAGGLADAALTIEGQCEEDDSSVADLVLLGLSPRDVVVGMSASGSAFFVRSGLAFAQKRRCRTLLIHEAETSIPVDLAIRLHSGPEVIRGSTRMKAGTATKKALNILSTGAMVLLGKVREGEMIDLQCSNAKLRARAERILSRLTGSSISEAEKRLAEHGYDLRAALGSPPV